MELFGRNGGSPLSSPRKIQPFRNLESEAIGGTPGICLCYYLE